MDRLSSELSAALAPARGQGGMRAALPALGDFLARHRGRDLARFEYAPALYLAMNGEHATAVIDLEAYFQRYPSIPVPGHDRLVGQVFLEAIAEEATQATPDAERVKGWALRALDLRQPPTRVGRTVQTVLAPNTSPAAVAVVRTALVRQVLRDQDLTDLERDEAFAALYGAGVGTGVLRAPDRADAASAPLELKATTLSGRALDLRTLRGRVVLVHFWASWCPITHADAPALVALHQRYHTRGFDVVGAALDASDDATVRAAAHDLGFTWEHLHDGSFDGPIARRFGVEMLPYALLLDQEGRVTARGDGARGEALERRLAELFDASAKR